MKTFLVVSIVATAVVLIAGLSLAPAIAGGQAATGAIAKPRGGPFPWVLTVYDRQGKVVRTVGEPETAFLPAPAFSPDGTRLVAVKTLSGAPGTELRVFDLSTGVGTPVVSGAVPRGPVWSPDGRQIAYYSYRRGSGALYRAASNGTGAEELLYRFPDGISDVHISDWSPDGRFLIFDSSAVVWLLPLTRERKAVELLREDFQVFGARFSPDGRFLAYNSDESGRTEVYVRAFDPSSGRFPAGSGKWRVSRQGSAGMVHWRRDSRELFYLAPDGGVMAVDVTTAAPFTSGSPRLLFRTPDTFPVPGTIPPEPDPDDDRYGRFSPDGQRIAFQVRTVPERKVIAVSPEILAKYAGTYVNGNNSVVLTVEGNQLMAQDPTGRRRCASCALGKFQLFAESETSFFDRHPDLDGDLEFAKDDKGAVTHFLIFSGGAGSRWTRTEARTEVRAQIPAKSKGGPFPLQLTMYDRQGKVLSIVPYNYGNGSTDRDSSRDLSPDGTRLVAGGGAIWLVDPATGTGTQVAIGTTPGWSPDGSQILFFRSAIGDTGRQSLNLLYRKPLNGTGREQLLHRLPFDTVDVFRPEWSPDGRFVIFQTAGVLWILPLTGERTPVELAREEYLVTGPRFSPDGRFLAYFSTESGDREVYVRPFDPASGRFAPGGPWRVSDKGAQRPVQWRPDGRELYYMASDRGVMAVEVTTTPGFTAAPPRLLFRAPDTIPITEDYIGIFEGESGALTRDGMRFQFVVPVPPARKVVTVAPEILLQYTGTYVAGNNAREVTLEGNRLMFRESLRNSVPRPGNGRALLPESETYFFLRRDWADEADVEFFKDDKGAVTHLLVYQGVGETKWARQ